ncbi:MobV family relaxase [Burkholderia orbicola]|uniref:MobV family relaxase n=1 Tax=Burkholderia orbicola TaxID=2978683 RepID=UPI002650F5AD|nr:MobV family relaxase [Burkholderia orbicola]MDN7735239.1 MobV family relaxase [Burkholderia orbicola]
MAMKNYAITRIKKYRSVGSASYLLNHHLRLVEVANADPSKKAQNTVLMHKPNIMGFLNEVPKGSKSNACRFVDVVFTATEFTSKKQRDEWVQASMDFALKEFGEDNIALAVLHMDEKTPHIHLIFKPVNPKTNKLGAGYWFDGRLKMKSYQDRYFKGVEALGFDRGDPNKRAHHKTISQYYKDLARAEDSYKKFEKDLVDLYKEIGQTSVWDRLKPTTLQGKLKPLFGKVIKSAKKVMAVKELMQVEAVSQKNSTLIDQVEHLQMKLQDLTGSPNPSPQMIMELRPVIEEVQARKLELDRSVGTPPHTPPAWEIAATAAGQRPNLPKPGFKR